MLYTARFFVIIRGMIAKRVAGLDSSHIRAAFVGIDQSAQCIDLSIGYPQDPMPDYICQAAVKALDEGFTRYTPCNGIFELREAVAEKLKRDNGLSVIPELVTITPGVTGGIRLACRALLDPGDEALLPVPCFPPYISAVEGAGAVAVTIDTCPDFQLTAEMVERHLTPKTKVLFVNSPNNPTGAVYPEDELRRIAEVARRHDLVIISDEIYECFAYQKPHFSIGSIYPQTVTLNGFSKAYAMTGLRVGYMAGPKAIISAVVQVQQFDDFANSSIGERAALAALRRSPDALTHKYRDKSALVRQYLRPDFDLRGAEGAFFAFVPLPRGVTDLEFCAAAARQGVKVLPSRVFLPRNDYFRVSFAVDNDDLRRGLAMLRAVAKELSSGRRTELVPKIGM